MAPPSGSGARAYRRFGAVAMGIRKRGSHDREGGDMAVRTTTQGILSEEHAEKRREIIELLTKAYWMEIETVMSYIANSVNLDGIRAEEIKNSLATDITDEIRHAQLFG